MEDNVTIACYSALSSFGSAYVFMALIPAIYWFIGKRHALNLSYAFILAAIGNIWLKTFFHIPRPPPEQWAIDAHGYGFPSGHTMVTTAFWFALYFSLRKRISEAGVNIALLLAFLMPFLVGISRIALGVHSVMDVVGGFGFGLIAAFATVVSLNYILPAAEEFDRWQRMLYPFALSLFMFSVTAIYVGVDYIQLYDISKICGAFFGFSIGYMKTPIEKLPITKKIDIIKYYIVGLSLAVIMYMLPMPIELLLNDPNYNLISYYIRSALFAICVTYWYPKLILHIYKTSGKDLG